MKTFVLIQRRLLTEYVLSTSFILITLLHNAVRKLGTFIMRHPVFLTKVETFDKMRQTFC